MRFMGRGVQIEVEPLAHPCSIFLKSFYGLFWVRFQKVSKKFTLYKRVYFDTYCKQGTCSITARCMLARIYPVICAVTPEPSTAVSDTTKASMQTGNMLVAVCNNMRRLAHALRQSTYFIQTSRCAEV